MQSFQDCVLQNPESFRNAVKNTVEEMDAKILLRSQIRAALKKMSAAQRASASGDACALLRSRPEWQAAASILFFAPLKDEIDLRPLMSESIAGGKTAVLPRFNPNTDEYRPCMIQNPDTDLTPGPFGVREPTPACPEFPLNRLDFALVPGVGFDRHGRRLGRGKGYYDRLLATCTGLKCGVGFDEQIVDRIPDEPHDIRLDCILTPSQWFTVNGMRRH